MTSADTSSALNLRPLPLLCTRSTDESLTLLNLLAFHPSAGRHLPAALLQQLPQGEVAFYTEVFDGVPFAAQQSLYLQIAFHPFLLRDSARSQSFQWALYTPECPFSNFTITINTSDLQQAEIWLSEDGGCEGTYPSLSICPNVVAAVFFSLCISQLRSAVTRHVVILDNGYLASLVACLTMKPEPLDLRLNICSNVLKFLTDTQSEGHLIEEYVRKTRSMHKENIESAGNCYRYFLVYLAWEELDLQQGDWESRLKHLSQLEEEAANSEEMRQIQAQLRLKTLVWRAETHLIRWLQLI